MKNKYSDASLRRYIEYFVFRHVFLHEQVFMGKFVPSPLVYLPRTAKQTKKGAKIVSTKIGSSRWQDIFGSFKWSCKNGL